MNPYNPLYPYTIIYHRDIDIIIAYDGILIN